MYPVLLLVIYASWFTTTIFSPSVHAQESPQYVTIDSTDSTKFNYNGQQVMLEGVNFNNLNALGIWQASDISKISVGAGDYEQVASLGANHVRFGISYQWYESNPTEFYQVLDQHVQWARDNDLWLILVDFTLPYLNENTDDELAHPQGGCYQGYGNPCNFWGDATNEIAAREDFKNFWYDVVSHYENNDTVVGYDFINEPWAVDENYQRDLFSYDYFQELISGIVSGGYNSTQLFFLESEPEPLSWFYYPGYWSGAALIENLITTSNNRVVMSAHMYEPMNLTHYTRTTYPTTQDGVVWSQATMTDPTSPDAYPGKVVKKLMTGSTVTVNSVTYSDVSDYFIDYPHDIRNRFGILNAQIDMGIPIYIGEWSAQQTAQSDGSGWYTDTFINYNQDVANLFNDWGVHNAVYVFKAGHENWGLYHESGAQAAGSFNEVVSYNVDDPSQTVQPFIDTLSSIWTSLVKPDFPAGEATSPSTGNDSDNTDVPQSISSPSNSSTSNSFSSNFSAALPPLCTAQQPVGIVDLFQIDRQNSDATLFFTPVAEAREYSLIFGYQEGDERFGGIGLSSTTNNQGVHSITVHDLDPQATYAFKIIPVNECATGQWSNWLQVKGTNRNGLLQKFYRYVQS